MMKVYMQMKEAVQSARAKGDWVVLVCLGSLSDLDDYRKALKLTCSPQDHFSGRTAEFFSGGKVSVVHHSDGAPASLGESYRVEFLGSGGEVEKWLKAS